MSEMQPELMALEPDWSASSSMDVHAANTFALVQGAADMQGVPSDLVLLVGYATMPLLFSTDPARVEDMMRQLDGRLPVHPVAKVALTRKRAEELAATLLDSIAKYDLAVEQAKAQGEQRNANA